MAKYIIYCFNEAGRISRSEWIDAAGDEDALERARALKLPHGCEVWERDRRVGKVDPLT
ncbi:MAG TPA: hypothetical protein VJM15_05440 [Sphingomicrobium sp.]|nr:hypothetical protein [Sphingomicrobium sp.]